IMKQEGTYYRGFTEEEFAADEYFQQWVLLPDDETELYWKSYAQDHPEQQIAITNAFKLVQHLAETGFHIPFLSQSEKQVLRDQIFQQISLPHKTIVTDLPRKKIRWWVLAAAAIVALVAVSIFFPIHIAEQTAAGATTSHKTGLREVKKIMLPDSSLVVLNGNSSLRYNSDLSTRS